jgi:2-(1,2-epoxy-1,2-dihydrophenyl)acetyl-CoA isomerase
MTNYAPAMSDFGNFGDVHVSIPGDRVATMEIKRPPNNFFDLDLIESLTEAIAILDDDPACRAIVLCSEGKHFCAGANFASNDSTPTETRPNADGSPRHLYDAAFELFSTRTPVVAAVQGAAVGGGLGVACFSDFRIAAPEARFTANFARLGFHHGFGLSATLPPLVGQQRALELLYTGKRINGEQALAIGLADRLVPLDQLRETAHEFAVEIATSAPLAVASIRQTMRGDLAQRVKAATDREKLEQDRLRKSDDWAEGVAAMADRRVPDFKGQ